MFQYATDRFAETAPAPLALAVVVPTFNERDNIAPLIERLETALLGIEWEAVFVDDNSTDGTAARVIEIARTDRRIRLVSRHGRRGLSTAVTEGMLASAAPVLAVIDADMQHDESILATLYRSVADEGQDLAIGTRYSAGGSIGDWDARRARVSTVSTRLAALVLRTRVSDPMSGFFAIRREAFLASLPRLSGMGYKILLDIIASAPAPLAIREIPYCFRRRETGESKLDAMVAMEYALLLADKTVGRLVPIRFLMFAGVGALGLVVHLALLGAIIGLGLPFTAAQTSAVVASMAFNFLLNNRFTYRDRRLTGLAFWRGMASFYLVCGLGALGNVGVGTLVYGTAHTWWLAGAAGAAIGAVWNYAATSCLTWRR
jgi:dolichol-phosphate mannosyltransferase